MKIGNLRVAVGGPDPERLLASTGQSIASMRRLLDGKLIPGLVAAALHACMKAEREIHDLAVRIEREGVDHVRALVRELYGDESAAEPAQEGEAHAPQE